MNIDSQYWESPLEFKPERFLEKENLRSKVFFPFGGGHRLCIGKKIAHLEAVSFLARVIQEFNFTLSNGFVPQERFSVTLSMENGLFVLVEKRAK
jgi:cytochrome P450